MKLKHGTRVEVAKGGFGFTESWDAATIVIPRKSKYRPGFPAGYHAVRYGDGSSMAVHETSMRVTDTRKAFQPET